MKIRSRWNSNEKVHKSLNWFFLLFMAKVGWNDSKPPAQGAFRIKMTRCGQKIVCLFCGVTFLRLIHLWILFIEKFERDGKSTRIHANSKEKFSAVTMSFKFQLWINVNLLFMPSAQNKINLLLWVGFFSGEFRVERTLFYSIYFLIIIRTW